MLQSEALDEARNEFEAEKKGLLEEINFLQGKCRSALSGTVLPETDERAKLAFERNKAASELQQCRAELEAVRKAAIWNEELMRRKESDLMRSREREEQAIIERDDLKRCCESLETRLMVLEMEKKNIQQIEERKYQVLSPNTNAVAFQDQSWSSICFDQCLRKETCENHNFDWFLKEHN